MKERYITRECKTHGIAEFILENRGAYRCKRCRSDAVTRKRRNLKKKAVDYLGGKCKHCGYSKSVAAMDFHHPEDNKEFGISVTGNTISWERLKVELDKCILLCANCHREEHAKKYIL